MNVKNGIFFAAGFLLARLLILKMGEDKYKQTEGKIMSGDLDGMKEWLGAIFPERNDSEIGDIAMSVQEIMETYGVDEATALSMLENGQGDNPMPEDTSDTENFRGLMGRGGKLMATGNPEYFGLMGRGGKFMATGQEVNHDGNYGLRDFTPGGHDFGL